MASDYGDVYFARAGGGLRSVGTCGRSCASLRGFAWLELHAPQIVQLWRTFLGSDALEATACLILDIAMPGMTGHQLQRELKRTARAIPIVFITAQRDGLSGPQVLAEGAIACLFKPFSDTELLDALRTALGQP